uniref:Vesicular, overexpressed in cancer, prosurvival protein 1 n=1 Tax=Biomphalaria glabrata TaxID=6526 RepID=A0A2C9LAV8_BIOGL
MIEYHLFLACLFACPSLGFAFIGYSCTRPYKLELYNYECEQFICDFGCCGPEDDQYCCMKYPGPIIGIVIGVVLFIALIVFVIFCYKTKCRYCPTVCKSQNRIFLPGIAIVSTQNQMVATNGYPLSTYGNAGTEPTPFGINDAGYTNYGQQPPLGGYTANGATQGPVFTYATPSTLT